MEIPKSGLLEKIRPPRLEDAGLEDCALPPDSILEAFQKAAAALRSVASPSPEDEADGHCVNDPWESTEVSSDALLGIPDDIPEGRAAKKKGDIVPSVEGDDVVIEGVSDGELDDAVSSMPEPEKEKACIDGLQGLKISDVDGDQIVEEIDTKRKGKSTEA